MLKVKMVSTPIAIPFSTVLTEKKFIFTHFVNGEWSWKNLPPLNPKTLASKVKAVSVVNKLPSAGSGSLSSLN